MEEAAKEVVEEAVEMMAKWVVKMVVPWSDANCTQKLTLHRREISLAGWREQKLAQGGQTNTV